MLRERSRSTATARAATPAPVASSRRKNGLVKAATSSATTAARRSKRSQSVIRRRRAEGQSSVGVKQEKVATGWEALQFAQHPVPPLFRGLLEGGGNQFYVVKMVVETLSQRSGGQLGEQLLVLAVNLNYSPLSSRVEC